jgi:hypothetical protein
LRRAQEAEAVRQNFADARATDLNAALGDGFQDGEHHVLATQRIRALDLEGFGERQQFGRRLTLELLQREGCELFDCLCFSHVFLEGIFSGCPWTPGARVARGGTGDGRRSGG